MLVFRSAVADWNQVPSGSMKPSILAGDRIVVDKLAYDLRVPFTLLRLAHWDDPRRGDIVTFPSPADERLFVKRVIGVPGDVIELDANRLVVNGEAARYTPLTDREISTLVEHGSGHYHYFYEEIGGDRRVVMFNEYPRRSRHGNFGPVRVPDGHYFMLGDNRDNSGDSRVIGLVSRDRILGRAHAIAFSLDYDHYYLPRSGRFFTDLD